MKSSLPALIILVLNMAGMNGLEILEHLKPLYNVLVILYTTSCPDDLKRKAKALGAIDCIQKGTSYSDNLKFAKYVSDVVKNNKS